MPTKQYRLIQMYDEYGVVADDHARFQIWGMDNALVRAALAGEPIGFEQAYRVVGEVGSDWTEMVEVASYFNMEGDGSTYFVGMEDRPQVLRPSWREMSWTMDFYERFPDMVLSYEEKLAFALMDVHTGNDWMLRF